jgi:hypothetical protein
METTVSKDAAGATLAQTPPAITQESYDEKKVMVNFRDRETKDESCLSNLSPLLSFMSGGQESDTQPDTASNDHMHVPGFRDEHDIRLKTITLLTAMIDHDQYLDFKDRCYLQLAIEVIGSASMKQDLEDSSCGGA